MKRLLIVLFALLFCIPVFASGGKNTTDKEQTADLSGVKDAVKEISTSVRTVTAPIIIDRPVRLTEYRKRLTREYAFRHYGEEFTEIVPQAVIVHWTESPEADGVYEYFYKEARADGTLNVCSQFLVDRDGTIFRLTPETMLDRHAIGYNWCAIGIENVGGVDRKEDLTPEQLQADVLLIRYLDSGTIAGQCAADPLPAGKIPDGALCVGALSAEISGEERAVQGKHKRLLSCKG